MKILIDMNLSPAWVSVLEEAGYSASHWSTIGSLNAPDREVLLWAKANGYAAGDIHKYINYFRVGVVSKDIAPFSML